MAELYVSDFIVPENTLIEVTAGAISEDEKLKLSVLKYDSNGTYISDLAADHANIQRLEEETAISVQLSNLLPNGEKIKIKLESF